MPQLSSSVHKDPKLNVVYHLSQIICCQTYYASMDNLGQKFLNQPVEVFITSFLLLVYLVLLIPLYIKRRKNEQQDQPINFNQIPKSLESLLMNFGIITTSLLMWILFYVMNRYGFSSVKLKKQNKKCFTIFIAGVSPTSLTSTLTIYGHT